jgi:hypothetical protein
MLGAARLTGRNGHDRVGDFVSKISFSRLFHLAKDHCRNFLGSLSRDKRVVNGVGTTKTYEFLILAPVLNTNYWFTAPLFDLEGPVLHVVRSSN